MSQVPNPGTGDREAATLAELRARIDAIDEAMHRLLVERSSVIDALIHAKGTNRPGAAFRPQREAEMMRRLVGRHSGHLPLTTVEHLWREIITTFTHMQAPFGLILDRGDDGERMRDLARFYFGFSVDVEPVSSAEAVVKRVAETESNLGLIAPRRIGSGAPAWWRGLGGAGPQIMAVLPFIGADKPGETPAFVISPRLSDPTPPDLRVYAASAQAPGPVAVPGTTALAEADGEQPASREVLLAAEPSIGAPALAAAGLRDIREVGGLARGIAIEAPASVIRDAMRIGEDRR